MLRCIQEGPTAVAGKSDMSMAFRNLPMFPGDWCLLIMKAQSPVDGHTYYFVDKCLPFGCSISCALFQAFSDAVVHIVEFFTHKGMVNYLDDYFFVAMMVLLCNGQIQKFLDVCKRINFPVSLEKTFWASRVIVFLGLLIDLEKRIVSIPIEKIEAAQATIQMLLKKKKMTILQLQKICGTLNFFGRAIIPGRAFTRRLYMHIKKDLKPHHHIAITREIKQDLSIWQQFLNEPAAFCRPFTDFDAEQFTTEDIDLYTDVAKNPKLGMGGVNGANFFM